MGVSLVGGGVKKRVVDYANSKLGGSGISKARAASSYFDGLWNLIEVEIGSITRGMAAWTHGSLEPYLRMFPIYTQLVSFAHKPKVARAMLLKLERLILYSDDHPDVLEFLAANCLLLRETHIENYHSILTHYVHKSTPSISHGHYMHATSVVKNLRRLRDSLAALADHKPSEYKNERAVLLERFQSKTFDGTNTGLDEFLYTPFEAMIDMIAEDKCCSGKYSDDEWPRRDRLAEGHAASQTALDSYVLYFEGLKKAAVGEGLEGWLWNPYTRNAMMQEELRRRGLTISGSKQQLVERILDHARANQDGFLVQGDAEKQSNCPPRYDEGKYGPLFPGAMED